MVIMMAIPRAVVILSLTLLLFVSPLCTANFILYSPEKLSTDESLDYGPYKFIMQKDCNLVLYDNGKPVWASNTGGLATNCYAIMQSDGNLVVYSNNNNKAIWASNTARDKANYVLMLQKDRNVVIYGPAIWATNTYVGPSSTAIVITSNASTKVASLPANVTNAAGINAIAGHN